MPNSPACTQPRSLRQSLSLASPFARHHLAPGADQNGLTRVRSIDRAHHHCMTDTQHKTTGTECSTCFKPRRLATRLVAAAGLARPSPWAGRAVRCVVAANSPSNFFFFFFSLPSRRRNLPPFAFCFLFAPPVSTTVFRCFWPRNGRVGATSWQYCQSFLLLHSRQSREGDSLSPRPMEEHSPGPLTTPDLALNHALSRSSELIASSSVIAVIL